MGGAKSFCAEPDHDFEFVVLASGAVHDVARFQHKTRRRGAPYPPDSVGREFNPLVSAFVWQTCSCKKCPSRPFHSHCAPALDEPRQTVPEGTAVCSADDGVVAYAGNELKGYGNFVLVRHANGFVTAYANGSKLLVKRNDPVYKGQVILLSGQTGNATTPQLHFEIRKNSAPVDPMQFLPSDRTDSSPL
jgi:hypothetical protein